MKMVIISFLFFLVNFSAFSQNLPPDLNDWYLYTSDDNQLYVAESTQVAEDSVIVLHGGWGAEYSYLVPALRPLFESYHFTFYDQRGSLRSPAPDSTISLPRFVKDLEELRQELNIQKVTLLSHSMGARLAYAYLREHPNHVKGLVLTGPVPPGGMDENSRKQLIKFGEKRAKKEYEEEGLAKKHLTDKEQTHKWKIRFASANIYHVGRWRQMRGGQAFYNQGVVQPIYNNTPDSLWNGFEKTLIKYHKPSFIIIGDHDLVDFGLDVWPDLASEIPNMELLKLTSAGHNSWIDRPVKFRDHVNYALDQINK